MCNNYPNIKDVYIHKTDGEEWEVTDINHHKNIVYLTTKYGYTDYVYFSELPYKYKKKI